ncbi:MAG TPA: PH domain-containing protein [Myxococcota bacterium]|nr:PH domain-containing protein [Myxococcota bacterium]
MQTLDPRIVQLWRLQALIRLLIFWLPVTLGVAVVGGARFGLVPTIILSCFFLVFQLGLGLIWPALAWRRHRYSVREHDLLVGKGVLFRHTVSVPLGRIQHVDTRQGPMERWLGLSSLVVYTAAGLNADASIPGLEEGDALHLRDVLARRGGDDGV